MTNESLSPSQSRNTEEFMMGDYLKGLLQKFRYSLHYWRAILLCGLVISICASLYAIIIPPRYLARVNFVIEENKQNAGGFFSALAGQIGMDISAVTGSTGLLAGDNVLQLLKSPTLLKKVLLTGHPFDTSHSLAWHYASRYGLLNQYASKIPIKDILFPIHAVPGFLGRTQDSLINQIVKRISENELSVFKPDRKLSIFSLELTTRDELLSQQIALRLIKEASDLYIDTKTRRLRINAERLQNKTDSIAKILNKQTFSTAAANLFNANPGMNTTFANLDISAREKAMLGVLYADLNKSLEITRTALIQETPTIEIIDRPTFPLQKVYLKWYRALLLGFVSGVGFFYLLFFFGLFHSKRYQKSA
ncbi:MAG: hypothetical protein EBQ65_00300 [Chitinophagaceae bacterium]|nr:hypothetical protein [Chitinophagaceae bacterium]